MALIKTISTLLTTILLLAPAMAEPTIRPYTSFEISSIVGEVHPNAGNLPFRGEAGVEWQWDSVSVQAHYAHGSHADVQGIIDHGESEYYFDGVGVEVKLFLGCWSGC